MANACFCSFLLDWLPTVSSAAGARLLFPCGLGPWRSSCREGVCQSRFNKSAGLVSLLFWSCAAGLLLAACRGGEGEEESMAALCGIGGSTLYILVRVAKTRCCATLSHLAGRGGEGERRRAAKGLVEVLLLAGRGGEGERRVSFSATCWDVLWRLASELAGSVCCRLMVLCTTGVLAVGISLNKPAGCLAVFALLDVLCCCAVASSPAGRGGEGRRPSGVSACALLRCWNCCLLHVRANHTVARSATVISGQKRGSARRRNGVYSTFFALIQVHHRVLCPEFTLQDCALGGRSALSWVLAWEQAVFTQRRAQSFEMVDSDLWSEVLGFLIQNLDLASHHSKSCCFSVLLICRTKGTYMEKLELITIAIIEANFGMRFISYSASMLGLSLCASKNQCSGFTLCTLRAADHSVCSVFVPLGLMRRIQVIASPMLLLRFGGEDSLGSSSVLVHFYLQLNPLPRSRRTSRLLVEPLALRMSTLQQALDECGCRFLESGFSPDPLAGSGRIRLNRQCDRPVAFLLHVLVAAICFDSVLYLPLSRLVLLYCVR